MHSKQRSYLRAQLAMTVQIRRKELMISIPAEGNNSRLLGGTGKSLTPRRLEGQDFPRDKP